MTARSGTTLLVLAMVVLAMAAALGGCTAPRLIAPEDPDSFYARASLRLDEMGVVVLRFSVGPDGKAREPILHDEPLVINPYKRQDGTEDGSTARRLIESAEKYIRAAKFDARAIDKRELTASFVFEVKPCGRLAHSGDYDYAITLCLERPPRVMVPMS
jgi:hypothetical protein